MKVRLQGREVEYALPAVVSLGSTEREALDNIRRRAQGAHPSVLDKCLQTGMVGGIPKIKNRIRELEGIGVQYLLLQFGPTLQGMREFVRAIM